MTDQANLKVCFLMMTPCSGLLLTKKETRSWSVHWNNNNATFLLYRHGNTIFNVLQFLAAVPITPELQVVRLVIWVKWSHVSPSALSVRNKCQTNIRALPLVKLLLVTLTMHCISRRRFICPQFQKHDLHKHYGFLLKSK